MSVFPDGSKIKTEVPVRNRRSRCRESARNNSEAQRWHSQLPPTEIELLDLLLGSLLQDLGIPVWTINLGKANKK